jgi:hypothetical protein
MTNILSSFSCLVGAIKGKKYFPQGCEEPKQSWEGTLRRIKRKLRSLVPRSASSLKNVSLNFRSYLGSSLSHSSPWPLRLLVSSRTNYGSMKFCGVLHDSLLDWSPGQGRDHGDGRQLCQRCFSGTSSFSRKRSVNSFRIVAPSPKPSPRAPLQSSSPSPGTLPFSLHSFSVPFAHRSQAASAHYLAPLVTTCYFYL